MKKLVSTHWSQNELIGIDCILKNDGTVIILNCYSVGQGENKKHNVFPVCETNVHSLEKYNDDIWSEVDIFTEKVSYNDAIFFGGEGSMGNEGFIACTDKDNGLNWAIFFVNSNPFYKIEIIEDIIYAYSSLDLVYQVDIHSLEKITIEHKVWRM
jgi:hypothetical protein